jgi:hypothetical protein
MIINVTINWPVVYLQKVEITALEISGARTKAIGGKCEPVK